MSDRGLAEPPTRTVRYRYRDPLDTLWLQAADQIGLAVVRSEDVFASSSGTGRLAISTDAHLDADDCLAQMIFHELCHSLIAGRDSFEVRDWGLAGDGSPESIASEHACLRLQAFLAGRYGLRRVLAPTTDFRSYYDQLPRDPLADLDDDVVLSARMAVVRSGQRPWAPHLVNALERTAQMIEVLGEVTASDALLGLVQPAIPAHPAGGLAGAGKDRCGECAWRTDESHCVRFDRAVSVDLPSCDVFQRSVDCSDCGACCREGYDSVTIDADDPVRDVHRELVRDRGSYLELARDGGRCVALEGTRGTFHCRIYDERPRCCAELERGGIHCLVARQRVGLTL